jgi:hypothetical protein
MKFSTWMATAGRKKARMKGNKRRKCLLSSLPASFKMPPAPSLPSCPGYPSIVIRFHRSLRERQRGGDTERERERHTHTHTPEGGAEEEEEEEEEEER